MRIAVGGLQKNFIEQSIKNFDSSIETIVTNDMNGAKLINEKKLIIILEPVRVEVDQPYQYL